MGLKETAEADAGFGLQLFIVAQVPEQIFEPTKVYYAAATHQIGQRREFIRNLSVPLAEHRKLQFFVSSLFKKYQHAQLINLVSLDDVYCDQEKRPIGDERRSYYFDSDHLSVAGAQLAVAESASWLAR